MLTLSVLPSSPDYPLINLLAEMIARYTNAHCHFDLKDMSEAERLAEIEALKDWLEELLH